MKRVGQHVPLITRSEDRGCWDSSSTVIRPILEKQKEKTLVANPPPAQIRSLLILEPALSHLMLQFIVMLSDSLILLSPNFTLYSVETAPHTMLNGLLVRWNNGVQGDKVEWLLFHPSWHQGVRERKALV